MIRRLLLTALMVTLLVAAAPAFADCKAVNAKYAHGSTKNFKVIKSVEKTSIRFHGREVPICWIHRRMWERCGENAEANAELYWHWSAT